MEAEDEGSNGSDNLSVPLENIFVPCQPSIKVHISAGHPLPPVAQGWHLHVLALVVCTNDTKIESISISSL